VKAFFSNPQRCSQLAALAQLWIGTPFHAHASIRGAGVDCVHLCAAIYIECGALEIFNPPKYALDGGQHASHSLITDWVEKCGRFEAVTPYQHTLREQIRVGDLLCFKVGRVAWHVGLLFTEKKFIHALAGVGVAESFIGEQVWQRRLIAAYRPVEVRP
jgi:NlpC/P60 family putative phage cell wall peptidase